MMNRWVLVTLCSVLVLTSASCGGDDGDGGGGGENLSQQAQEIEFSGEQSAFPDYMYDSGWLPEESPVQVRVTFSVTGKLEANANALVGGDAENPMMSGVADSGLYGLDAALNFQVLVKMDLPGFSYEGPVDENADISYMVSGQTMFAPFATDAAVPLMVEIPETMLATLPLAGSIPGVEGNVIVDLSGVIHSDFQGTCASVNEQKAQYLAETRTRADLILKPSIMVSIPFVFDETIEVGEVPVSVPEVAIPMDMGTIEVSPGGGAVDGGGSMAKSGSCDDAPNNSNPNNSAPNNANPNNNTPNNSTPNNSTPNNSNPNNSNNTSPECVEDEDCSAEEVCYDGICIFVEETCMSDIDCPGGEVCDGGVCITDPGEVCADTCGGGCCTEDGQCEDGDTGNACGSSGLLCQMCGDFEACIQGECQNTLPEAGSIRVVSAAIIDAEWGDIGSDPDLFVKVGLGYDNDTEEFLYEEVTRTIDDVLSATWNEVILTGIPHELLDEDGLSISLHDEDVIGSEYISGCSTLLTRAAFQGSQISLCESSGVNFMIELIPE